MTTTQTQTIESVLSYLRNHFAAATVRGAFVVDGGEFVTYPDDGAQPEAEQFYWVYGSVFNDGLHRCGDDDLTDETWTGTVELLNIPTPLLAIADDVAEYEAATAEAAQAPYKSESFDGYSYQLRTDASGAIASWQEVFRHKLARWRKI